jgi:hypothetical protein
MSNSHICKWNSAKPGRNPYSAPPPAGLHLKSNLDRERDELRLSGPRQNPTNCVRYMSASHIIIGIGVVPRRIAGSGHKPTLRSLHNRYFPSLDNSTQADAIMWDRFAGDLPENTWSRI